MASALDLTSYSALRQATFVKMTVMEAGSPVVVRMSSNNVPVQITESDGTAYTYVANGNLLNVTAVTSDMKATQNDVTITLSGISNNYIADIIAAPIKGNPVEIRRAFFNADTGAMLAIAGNPILEFIGVVNNYAVDESWSQQNTQIVTSSISLICSSTMSVLMHKVAGRRTNQADQNYWFPGDNCFNRVAVIADQVFDFGGTTPSAAISPAGSKVVTNTVTG
jgi:hypothetical protein